jgi:hypothetical protein
MIVESSPANEQKESVRILEAGVQFVRDVPGGLGENGLGGSKCVSELRSSARLHMKNGHF